MSDPTAVSKALILVADDDRLVRVTVASGLRKVGYEVVEAADGEQTLAVAARDRPDLVVLDLRMPKLSGLEAAARMRADTGVPFIVLSAYDDKDAVREAADAGALGYLVKPIDVRQMVPTIEAALDRAAEIRELQVSRAQLNTALEQGRETSVAVGILMDRFNLSERDAFDTLRRYARSNRRKLAEVSGELVRGVDAGNALFAAILRHREA